MTAIEFLKSKNLVSTGNANADEALAISQGWKQMKTKVVDLTNGVTGKDIVFFRPGVFRYKLVEVQKVIIPSKKQVPMNGVKLLLTTEAGISKTVQSIDSEFCTAAIKLGDADVENVEIEFAKDDTGYVNPVSIK